MMQLFFSSLLLTGLCLLCDTDSLVAASSVASSPLLAPRKGVDLRGGSSKAKLFGTPNNAAAVENTMATLFVDEDEAIYDTYAACLAATEGLRRIRDRDLAKAKRSDAKRRVAKQYVESSSKVLESLGMTVEEFNQIGTFLAENEELKEKVVEQAYLYRIAAAVTMDRSPLLLAETSPPLALEKVGQDTLQAFCLSMKEVETLRASEVEKLKGKLNVDDLPSSVSISDPDVLPFLDPQVRAFVEGFPLQAEEIVMSHGLEPELFNQLLEETKVSPTFRRWVQKQMQ